LRPIRPAHFDANAEIEGHAGERRIPLRDHAVASPFQRDRLRPIKHGHQGNATEGVEMRDECANERFHPLIGDKRDLDPPRVLQTGGEEMDLRLGPVVIRDEHFAEVVLRKLASQSLESDQRCHHARPQHLREGIQRRLPTRVARHASAMQELDRPERRVLG
jgi:hypothetical protein